MPDDSPVSDRHIMFTVAGSFSGCIRRRLLPLDQESQQLLPIRELPPLVSLSYFPPKVCPVFPYLPRLLVKAVLDFKNLFDHELQNHHNDRVQGEVLLAMTVIVTQPVS